MLGRQENRGFPLVTIFGMPVEVGIRVLFKRLGDVFFSPKTKFGDFKKRVVVLYSGILCSDFRYRKFR